MILESWSIALITCSLITLALGAVGLASAIRVVRFWDPGADSERQIGLEEQVWLAATLTQFGLVVQVVSAVVFIYAAGYFATLLKGAMCAAGAVAANAYGLPALAVKLITIFSGALWIVVHRLDIGCEDYPLTRIKSYGLLLIFPLLCADAFLVVAYLVNLDPQIITSCCGVLFGGDAGGGYSLFEYASPARLLWPTVLCGAAVVFCSLLLVPCRAGAVAALTGWAAIAAWIGFYVLALLVVTVVVSPYVYALPHHRCPFDLLHYPYAVVGVPLYLSLHAAVLSGLGGAAAALTAGRWIPAGQVRPFIRTAVLMSLGSLLLFVLIAAWPPVSYIVMGGQ
ncbi:MAG: hypothetical protein LJE64_08620 [Desulfofustis sp.]|nr:hypothetical protein [Desulfofustis sp.]